jgi:RNA polymerase sigma-70 factor (ECF subfamily)
MRLVREGSAEGLDQITRCYSERLMAAGRRHCRTRTEAEDAVQEALVSAAQHLTELRDDSRLEGWLVRVVASACRRISRGHKNAPPIPTDDEVEGETNDPEEEAARRELARLLERSLLELSAQDRSILLLAELEGFSSASIAAELGMTDGAVRVRLSRLRARLAAALRSEIDAAP